MKTSLISVITAICMAGAFTVHAQAPGENAAPQNRQNPNAGSDEPVEKPVEPGATGPGQPDSGLQNNRTPAPGAGASRTNSFNGPDERNLRLNFRGVPLEMVLNYLSDAAGFIIVLETEVKGKVDVWSNQPLNRKEAVDLLNTILNQNGYAAIQNGRTLRIVSRDEAKKRDLPVAKGNDPQSIPKTDQMVTQIIPVRYANATQLTKDLEPLLPSYATLTANESGNALILTDTQSNIRRMAEIIRAVDTSMTNNTAIRVFPLQYADAKDLANSIKDLFQPPATQNQNNNNNRNFFNRFFPGAPGGGGGGGGNGGNRGGNAGTPGAGGTSPNSRVAAVADERTNSLVVSAPDEIMPVIEDLVRQIDVNSTDVTELRVFHLLNADPVDVADIFAQLFPDPTTSRSNDQQNQFGFRFGGGPGGFGNRRNPAANQTSQRETKKGRVVAVADARTQSLIVSAARDLMPDIAAMIEQLDRTSTRRQRVYIYSLENADVQEVEQVVRDIFERSTITANRNTANQNSALQSRTQQLNQNNNSPARSNNGFSGGAQGNGGTFR